MRPITKQDDLNRIRAFGPTPEDLADARPRVRRAALCHMAASGDDDAAVEALERAVSDGAEVVFLAVARTILRKRVTLQGVAARDAVQSAIDLRSEKRGESYHVALFAVATEDAA